MLILEILIVIMDFCIKIEESDKVFVRKLYETNEENLKRDVEILREWLKKQPHLPQGIQDDKFFENFLIRNKCRVEKSKQKIENYYTLRGLRRELYSNYQDLIPSQLSSAVVPLPFLTEEKYRVITTKQLDPHPDAYNYHILIQTFLAVADLLFEYDYAARVILIMDFQDFTFNHLKRINPVETKFFIELIKDAYSNSIAGIEFVNTTGILYALLKICKVVLPVELYNKIHVHDTLESLHKSLPKKFLPKDFGGNLPTIAELIRNWDPVFKSNRNLFMENMKHVSNEELRTEPSKYENSYGIDGTFKKINLD